MITKIETSLSSIEIFEMIEDEQLSFILESSLYNEKYGRFSIISASPFEIAEFTNDEKCFEKFEIIMNKYSDKNYEGNLPFQAGAVGYISYDAGRFLENIPDIANRDIDIPDIYFGLYSWAFIIDHKENMVFITTADIDIEKEQEIIDYRKNQIRNFENLKLNKSFEDKQEDKQNYNDVNNKKEDKENDKKTETENENETENESDNNNDEEKNESIILRSGFTKNEYIQTIKKIKEYIKNGDIYQANLTQRFTGSTKRTALDIYKSLRKVSPTIFGGLLNFSNVSIISNSPERFISIKDRKIQARPIKGTCPRGINEYEDKMLVDQLKNSEKDKAELLMIVDLERNDLGRISKTGSVKVPELFAVEQYANVSHLVATVQSILDDNVSVFDAIKATFPGGSITGAPKIRAMEIIEELEPTRRNVYTGAIGYIGFDQCIDFNIAIRTIVKKDENISFQVGGGITWDSDPESEYTETLDKAKSIIKALNAVIFEDKAEGES